MRRELRVASWNIHACVGMDRRFDPHRIARILVALDADVVALQEFGSRRAHDLAASVGAATGARVLLAPTIEKHGAAFGNALLTRWPVRRWRRIDLGLRGREPRNAIDALLDVGGYPLRVVATHLGLSRAERTDQIEALTDLLVAPDDGALVLAGDFNEWRATPSGAFDSRLGATPRLPTFPAPWPLFALDRIWVQPRAACVALEVASGASIRVASDHRPVVATLRIG